MSIIFCGGGTGGHVIPNITLIKELRKENPYTPLLYIGQKNSMEEKLCHQHNIPFVSVQSGKLRRYFSFENFIDPFRIIVGVFQSLYYLRKHQAHKVFSKWGFGSLPVAIAAKIYKLPLAIHESDSYAGIANRFIGKFADQVFLWFQSASKYFPRAEKQNKIEVIGNIPHWTILDYHSTQPKDNTLKKILILWGSQWAESLNTWVQNNKNWLTKNYDITHQYGGKNTITIEKQENYHPIAFIQENYAQILAEADIVIARSGANTLAELGHFNTSCILVPYPYAAGNHQQHNAQEFIEQNERSLMILDKNIEKDLKKEQIEKLISKTNSSESQKQNNSPVNTIQHSFLK